MQKIYRFNFFFMSLNNFLYMLSIYKRINGSKKMS